jgi:peptidoglycan-N-acetylmuramic acid deacetylase
VTRFTRFYGVFIVKKLHFLAFFAIFLCLVLAACSDSTASPNSVASANSGQIVPFNPTTPVEATTLAAATPTITPQPLTPTPAVATLPTITPLPTATDVPPTTEPPSPTPTEEPEPTATLVPPSATPKPTNTAVPKTTAPTKAPATKGPPTLTPAPANPALSEIVRGKTGKKQVAITLDAGGDAVAFPKMIAALNKTGIKVTFFLTGTWAQQNPTFVQQIVASGMEVANHSWTHSDFTTLNETQIKDELSRTDDLLAKYTGESTKPLMRFPYGARNAKTVQVVNSLGYRSIYWTIDSLDSVGAPKTAQFLIDRITKQTDAQLDGQIILMHLGNATSGDALPVILQNLTSRGFKVVTISKLIG